MIMLSSDVVDSDKHGKQCISRSSIQHSDARLSTVWWRWHTLKASVRDMGKRDFLRHITETLTGERRVENVENLIGLRPGTEV